MNHENKSPTTKKILSESCTKKQDLDEFFCLIVKFKMIRIHILDRLIVSTQFHCLMDGEVYIDVGFVLRAIHFVEVRYRIFFSSQLFLNQLII